jgi:hypothetical protein
MASPSPAVAAPITTWLPGTGADEDLLAQLTVGHDELRALYAGLFDAGVDPVTLDLCRLRLATLIGSRADLAVRDPRAVAAGLDDETVGALARVRALLTVDPSRTSVPTTAAHIGVALG